MAIKITDRENEIFDILNFKHEPIKYKPFVIKPETTALKKEINFYEMNAKMIIK